MKINEELERLSHNLELLKQGIHATEAVQRMIAKSIDDINARLHNICNYVQTHNDT